MKSDCIFATYADLPDLDPDDRLAADALRDRGVTVASGVWNDPNVDWASARLCVIRSTWDYHLHYKDFDRWLGAVAPQTTLSNEAELIRWNGHKFYLRDLEHAGIPVVPSAWLERGERIELDALLAQRDWDDAILKPAYGAATSGVLRVGVTNAERRAGQHHLDGLLRDGDALVQPYFPSVTTYPERALVFIDGVYSHAVTKTPFQALLPAGEAGEAATEATSEEIAVAITALGAAPGASLYARVDLIRDEAGAIRVLELELIEPSLFFSLHPPAAARFAAAVIAKLATL